MVEITTCTALDLDRTIPLREVGGYSLILGLDPRSTRH